MMPKRHSIALCALAILAAFTWARPAAAQTITTRVDWAVRVTGAQQPVTVVVWVGMPVVPNAVPTIPYGWWLYPKSHVPTIEDPNETDDSDRETTMQPSCSRRALLRTGSGLMGAGYAFGLLPPLFSAQSAEDWWPALPVLGGLAGAARYFQQAQVVAGGYGTGMGGATEGSLRVAGVIEIASSLIQMTGLVLVLVDLARGRPVDRAPRTSVERPAPPLFSFGATGLGLSASF